MPLISTRIQWTIFAALLSMLMFAAMDFQWPLLFHRSRTMTDFDAFFVTGRMFWEGRLTEAYHFRTLLTAQHRLTGTDSFMPWTYPPPFDFIAAAIGALPIGLAYLMFTGISALAYLAVIRRLAGAHAGAVLLAVFPAVLLNIRTGQNGFLTGALLGFFFLSYLHGGWRGGFALGCMIIKPHLAVAAASLLLMERNWRCAAAAFGTAVGLAVISGLVFGWSVFAAFGGSLQEASGFLLGGYYLLFRMVSLYAALYTAGVPAIIAMSCQVAFAIMACGATVAAAWRLGDRRLVVGVASFASISVSPYCYDYDLTVLGLAAASIAPVLVERASPGRLLLLLPLGWLACGWGMVVTTYAKDQQVAALAHESVQYFSLGWPALVLIFYVASDRLRLPFFAALEESGLTPVDGVNSVT